MKRETEMWRDWPLPEPGTSLRTWQAGRCAWCGFEDSLVRDHCHRTGLIRGLLCRGCNSHEGLSYEPWVAWREGDNAARAIGHFEIYQDHMGLTRLYPETALAYYKPSEREQWWEATLRDLAAGGEWPAEAPWTEIATARRDRDWASLRDAVFTLPSVPVAEGGAS